MIKGAYLIEIGCTGLSFKKTNRYASVEEARDEIKQSCLASSADEKSECIYLIARD